MAEGFKPGQIVPDLACTVTEMGITPALNDGERAREIRNGCDPDRRIHRFDGSRSRVGRMFCVLSTLSFIGFDLG